MSHRTFKAALCLLLIALVFAGIGCAGRNSGSDQGSTATATPPAGATSSPSATPQPPAASPTILPGSGNYTAGLSPDDVSVSDGDLQDTYPEDDLPTPSAE